MKILKPYCLIFFLHSFFFCNSHALSQKVEWFNQLDSPESDFGTTLIVDNVGNTYVAGAFSGKLDFDPGPGTFFLESLTPQVFVAKYSGDGALLWAIHLKTYVNGNKPNLSFDLGGNLLIYAIFSGTIDFDPGPLIYNLTAKPNYGLYLLKLDTLGNFIWAKNVLDGAVTCDASSLSVDINNNVLLTGNIRGTADVDPGPLITLISSNDSNDHDPFIIKLNSVGNLIWARTFRGTSDGSTSSIISDDLGKIYVLGAFTGNTDFDPGIGNFFINGSINWSNMFLTKLSDTGDFIWAKAIIGSALNVAVGNDLALDLLGEILITGYFYKTIDFDPGLGDASIVSNGFYDIFLLKMQKKRRIFIGKKFWGKWK